MKPVHRLASKWLILPAEYEAATVADIGISRHGTDYTAEFLDDEQPAYWADGKVHWFKRVAEPGEQKPGVYYLTIAVQHSTGTDVLLADGDVLRLEIRGPRACA